MKDLKNIPSNSLVVVSANKDAVRRNIMFCISAVITLSMFALTQLCEGMNAMVEADKNGSIPTDRVKLLMILVELRASGGDTPREFTHQELAIMRKLIEARIAHCEEERDERVLITTPNGIVDKFNPDTYVGLKLLLLDIRDLLSGDILPE